MLLVGRYWRFVREVDLYIGGFADLRRRSSLLTTTHTEYRQSTWHCKYPFNEIVSML